jgi:molybdenum cofactor synthesis domain-containing protein
MPKSNTSEPISCKLIATGTEIILGSTVDTNTAFLSKLLSDLGVSVKSHLCLPDDLEELRLQLERAKEDFELVVMTGGLGPTEDDFTRLAAAKAWKRPMVYHRALEEEISAYISSKGFTMPKNNLRQAWLPKGAIHIPNQRGTAPAFAMKEKDHLSVFLPGVPHEASFLAKTALRRLISETFPKRIRRIQTYTLTAVGLGEGKVDALLSDLTLNFKNPSIGLSAKPYETLVRVTVDAPNEEEARILAEPLLSEIETRLGSNYAGEGDLGLLGSIARLITRKGYKLGIIDSITTGLLAQKLLSILPPNSSAGAVTLPFGPLKSSLAQDYLYHEGATLVLSLSCQTSGPRDDSKVISNFSESEQQMTVLTHILLNPEQEKWLGKKSPDKQFFQLTPLSGPPGTLTERAQALAAFQLWSYLKDSV